MDFSTNLPIHILNKKSDKSFLSIFVWISLFARHIRLPKELTSVEAVLSPLETLLARLFSLLTYLHICSVSTKISTFEYQPDNF